MKEREMRWGKKYLLDKEHFVRGTKGPSRALPRAALRPSAQTMKANDQAIWKLVVKDVLD